MTSTAPQVSSLSHDTDIAHTLAVAAATAGLSDSALGGIRLSGPHVETLADAAVASATPFLRAPLLARLAEVRLLHPLHGDTHGVCPSCQSLSPCLTARAVQW